MYVGKKFSFSTLWFFAWRNILAMFALSSFVYFSYEWLNWKFIAIPFLPVATIGTAVAFYVGFKNNSSYERLWEARRIWGGITNTSRSWAAIVINLLERDEDSQTASEIKKELIYRQMAWTNVLRVQLRRRINWNYESKVDELSVDFVTKHIPQVLCEPEIEELLIEFTSEAETKALKTKANIAAHLLKQQIKTVTKLKQINLIDTFEHQTLMQHVTECYNQQGAAERIKTFPFPRQYANFSVIFVYIFMFLLPFGLVREMSALGILSSWLLIPITVLTCWIFYTMERVGDASENPFENGLNDVPMTAICRTIEIDLKEMLGEQDLPQRIQPVNKILL